MELDRPAVDEISVVVENDERGPAVEGGAGVGDPQFDDVADVEIGCVGEDEVVVEDFGGGSAGVRARGAVNGAGAEQDGEVCVVGEFAAAGADDGPAGFGAGDD